jgi:hypothetical protein
MLTKSEVIELYLSNKIESEKLLQLMKDVDTDNPKFQENMTNIRKHIALIDIIIERINLGPTQDELRRFYNIAFSWGADLN